jgi:type IV secretion system protein VirB10
MLGQLIMTESTSQSKDGPQNSPDGLGFKTKPNGVIRVNKKAVAFAGFMLVLVLMAIMAGVVTRKPSTGIQSAGDNPENINNKLAPALMAGEQIARDIPDGNLPERKAQDDKALFAVRNPGGGVLDTPTGGAGGLSPAQVPPLSGAAPGAPGAPNLGNQQLPNGSQPPIDPVVEKARRLREEREARLKQAMEAGTTAQSSGAGAGGFQFSGGAAPGALGGLAGGTALQQLQALAAQGQGQRAPGLMPASMPGREEDDQNKQKRKEDFVRNMESVPDRNFVNSTRKAGLSKYEVKAGWVIPATMEHGINSDLPGKITARVTQNVWDTATGRFLMVPQGAQLMGTYDSQVAYGQNGLLVVWRRIIFPDGSSIDLEGMGGVDESGYSGFRDQINNHYGRIFGFGLLTSLFSAAFQITQNNNNQQTGQTPTPAQTAGTAVAQQFSQLGIEIARKNLRVQPTIEIRPGYQFNVRVDKDLVFPRPYVYGNAQ